ncbi:MAG: hypothetical protein R8K21_03345 [Mariprofundales bacterium]
MKIKSILAAFLLLFVASCNDNGGGSSAPAAATSPNARPMITNKLHVFNNGDFIDYSLSGSITDVNGKITISGTAKYSYTLNSSPIDPTGLIHNVEMLSMNAQVSNGTTTSPLITNYKNYYEQDANGNIFYYGDDISGWITTPAMGFVTDIKSPIITADSWIINFTQKDGTNVSGQISVQSIVTINIPLGSFESYKLVGNAKINNPDGSTDTCITTNYIVPSIGIIRSDQTCTSIDAIGAVTSDNTIMQAITTNIGF